MAAIALVPGLEVEASARRYVRPLLWLALAAVPLFLRAGHGFRVLLLAILACLALYRLANLPRSLRLDRDGFEVRWRVPLLRTRAVRWTNVRRVETRTGYARGGRETFVAYWTDRSSRTRWIASCFVDPSTGRALSAEALVAVMNAYRELA